MGEATHPIKLKEAGEVSATYIWSEVCETHWRQINSKNVEWVLEIGRQPMNPRWHEQALIVGQDLQVLDEHVIVAPPTLKERADLFSRIFSNNDEAGPHIDLKLRRRGSEEIATLTVVVPKSAVGALIGLLTEWQETQ